MPRPNCLFSWITQPSEVISNYETSGRLEWRRTNIQSWSCGTVWGTARPPRSPCSCMSARVLWKKWTAEEQQSPWLLAVVWPSSTVTALWGGSQHVEDIFLSPLYYCSFQINKSKREREMPKKMYSIITLFSLYQHLPGEEYFPSIPRSSSQQHLKQVKETLALGLCPQGEKKWQRHSFTLLYLKTYRALQNISRQTQLFWEQKQNLGLVHTQGT